MISLTILVFVYIILITINVCRAVNVKHFPWERMLSFVDMRYSDTAHFRLVNRRTCRFYESDYVAMYNLESIIYNLESINSTFLYWRNLAPYQVNYDDIWSLSKQIQLSCVGDISRRIQKLCQFVCKHILKSQRVFFENPKARKLMHALGFKSITIHEYNALNLNDDEHIRKLNITESGIKKLKLLLLASRASENYLTAVLNESSGFQQSADLQEREYNQIVSTHNIAGFSVWIWSNFPWLAAPESTYFPTYTSLLYFGALQEFLWSKYHHEFGFPEYDALFFISELDDEEMVKKVQFVKYMMDRYRYRIHETFRESKMEIWRWMEQYVQEIQSNDTGAEVKIMWINVRTAQRSLYWTLAEAVRLNKLLMADDEVLTNQFMTKYVLSILESCTLEITSRKEVPFVRETIMKLIKFNGPQEKENALTLREILRTIEQSCKMPESLNATKDCLEQH